MKLFYELIQVALKDRETLSYPPTSKEWRALYDAAITQALAGICFTAIQRLPINQRPDEELYWEWLGIVTQIQAQNEVMDRRTAKVWGQLNEAGLVSAVIKGQGIAVEYGELASFRQSGDIDIWVKGGYNIVCDYVQRKAPTIDLAYHRFHFDLFEDSEVELHFRPTLMRNLLDDRLLAQWYNSFGTDSFVLLQDKGFMVPSPEFNRIFILTHIYRHFLFEGIGLRQVMDYYFVLRNSKGVETEKDMLRRLKLMRFGEAIMWILHNKFGLEDKYLICRMNEKEGRFVLKEIEQTGNFGQGDTRYNYRYLFKLRRQIAHGSHLMMHYPSEVIWTPIWLIYHKIWKWNKRKI